MRASPPWAEKPPSRPSVVMTRWQGTNNGIGLVASARPTALAAFRLPVFSASAPYVRVFPGPTFRSSWFQEGHRVTLVLKHHAESFSGWRYHPPMAAPGGQSHRMSRPSRIGRLVCRTKRFHRTYVAPFSTLLVFETRIYRICAAPFLWCKGGHPDCRAYFSLNTTKRYCV